MSKTTIIKRSFDPDNPPPLTDRQTAMLDALDALPDSGIDYSDIPPHDFSRASVKKVATIRLDADVFAWLRTFGEEYQSRINAILRHEMLAAHKTKA